ncbi:coiled-coil domain-containing protein 50 isoform X1 [Xenopus laevis]|uniref:Coiled-coil domain-containing protein n=2 Tax=Xenopus laevis TaxID=8355 RepID=A0AA97PZ81_XENLA|nr:coiled-coil domain-containing protein 50 isoform X1 [Xenopus laevis]OCT56699.1 hypothetical protein XELAEV_18004531mg [Xenopus laevis]
MSGRKHIPNMSETAIDQSKLPGVKEVCRDFAVLEDHSLAHNLQEQEIEHHLTTNILRNRLVKNDLHVAKQLQEQEDLRTQARMKNRHNELEVLDSEIAQEIQDKLVIEAEHRRQQEEKDEDIARLLQEREERRRKKYYPPSQEEPSYKDREGHRKGRHKENVSEYDRPHRQERPEKNRFERNDAEFESTSSKCVRQRGRSVESRSSNKEEEDSYRRHYDRPKSRKEKPQRPPPPRTSRHEDDFNIERTNGEHHNEYLHRKGRSHSQDPLSTKNSDSDRWQRDSSDAKSHRSCKESDFDIERRRRRTPSPCQERNPRDSGFRSKGARDAPISKHMSGLRNQEEHDAHLARRLQEKELRVNIVDKRAAQMAQDEEIARYIMDKEEKAYKKSKGGGKMSDAKRPEELEASDHVRQRSREGHDHHHRSRSDKPYRPLHPPRDTAEDDYDDDYTNINQHNSPRSSSKSQSSLKGAYYRP